MKVLTLHEPWASLMRHRVKKIETRSWPTNYRGTMLIHASRKSPIAMRLMVGGEVLGNLLSMLHQVGGKPTPGCAVALADLEWVVPFEQLPKEYQTYQELACGGYGPNRYCWFFGNVRPLPEPIPMRGHQGLWHLQPADEDLVWEAVKDVKPIN